MDFSDISKGLGNPLYWSGGGIMRNQKEVDERNHGIDQK